MTLEFKIALENLKRKRKGILFLFPFLPGFGPKAHHRSCSPFSHQTPARFSLSLGFSPAAAAPARSPSPQQATCRPSSSSLRLAQQRKPPARLLFPCHRPPGPTLSVLSPFFDLMPKWDFAEESTPTPSPSVVVPPKLPGP